MIPIDESTEAHTDLVSFMEGLRQVVYEMYDRELPENDFVALRMFLYAGKVGDAEFRDHHKISFYDYGEQSHACLCGHTITDLYFIVPNWDNNCHYRFVVGSTCIKRFCTYFICKNCHRKCYKKLGDNRVLDDLCKKCSQCSKCSKDTKGKLLCLKCLDKVKSNITNKVIPIHLRKQKYKEDEYKQKLRTLSYLFKNIKLRHYLEIWKKASHKQCRKCRSVGIFRLFCIKCETELKNLRTMSGEMFDEGKNTGRTFGDVYGDRNEWYNTQLQLNGKKHVYKRYSLYCRLKDEWSSI